MVDIQCLRLDAAQMMSLLFCSFVSWGRGLIIGLGVRDPAGDWTAKDVKGDNSINEKSRHASIVSIDYLRLRLRAHLRINY